MMLIGRGFQQATTAGTDRSATAALEFNTTQHMAAASMANCDAQGPVTIKFGIQSHLLLQEQSNVATWIEV